MTILQIILLWWM